MKNAEAPTAVQSVMRNIPPSDIQYVRFFTCEMKIALDEITANKKW
jgi:hypothetical protein